MEISKGHLVLLMAPSGSGKKAVVDGLGELKNHLYFAKSYTSRAPRKGTEESPKYVFLSREEFERMIEADEFIEWANFSGNYMGTPKIEFVEPLKEKQIVFKEMELQGVQQIKKIFPAEKITTIYIDAGTWEELEKRVVARAPISEEALALRKERYNIEVKFKPEADIIISNKDGELKQAQAAFRTVISDLIQSTKS